MKLQYQAQVNLWTAVYTARYASFPSCTEVSSDVHAAISAQAAAAADAAVTMLDERLAKPDLDALASLRAAVDMLRADLDRLAAERKQP